MIKHHFGTTVLVGVDELCFQIFKIRASDIIYVDFWSTHILLCFRYVPTYYKL